MADSTAPEKQGKKATQTKPPTAHAAEERIVSVPLAELHPFPNHPFKVRDDETMQETAESIKQYGVLVPAIVRPRDKCGYEIVAGHRHKHACELAGLETMPVIVRNLDADAATIIMVDSNLQRENILPSERAQAYKMKLEAIKWQAGRPTKEAKENGAQIGHNFDGKKSVEIIADQAGESKSQVQRYIRLTELTPELQQMVDDKKIAMTPAVELSYLKPEEQALLLETIDSEQATPFSLTGAAHEKALAEGQVERRHHAGYSFRGKEAAPERPSFIRRKAPQILPALLHPAEDGRNHFEAAGRMDAQASAREVSIKWPSFV